MREKKTSVNFRLSDIELEYLNDAADYLGLNKSDTIRTLLRNFKRRIHTVGL
jgi:predicted DNA binding CopG/RHH family protein